MASGETWGCLEPAANSGTVLLLASVVYGVLKFLDAPGKYWGNARGRRQEAARYCLLGAGAQDLGHAVFGLDTLRLTLDDLAVADVGHVPASWTACVRSKLC